MKLIVGLGNPEEDYAKTRHNIGFDVINELSKEYKIEVNKNKFDGLLGMGTIENEKVILLKPQTFMNESGKSVIQVLNFYKIDIKDMIVIYDDMDIDKSKIRIRKFGSGGSHNGMKSIISCISNEKFTRIRVGIGKPVYSNDMINYVIGSVPEEEQKILSQGVTKAKDAIIEIFKNSVDSAMNKFN